MLGKNKILSLIETLGFNRVSSNDFSKETYECEMYGKFIWLHINIMTIDLVFGLHSRHYFGTVSFKIPATDDELVTEITKYKLMFLSQSK